MVGKEIAWEDLNALVHASHAEIVDDGSWPEDPLWEVRIKSRGLPLAPKTVRAASKRVAEGIVQRQLGDSADVLGANLEKKERDG